MTSDSIGRYQFIEEIGSGGMATVFRAHDPLFKRDVAIKLMTQTLLGDSTLKARFEREAQTIAALEHPAIVPVHDFGEEGGRPFLVMRLMTGNTLASRLKHGPLPINEVVKILTRIGSALDRAHEKGIIHRDLKPSNIMFDEYNDAYLTDFGIARLTESAVTLTGDSVLGTPAYMSPEQIHGDKSIDGRSDIYALGVICFEMLTGERPYMASTPTKVMMRHILDPVPNIREVNPNLPTGVDSVIAHTMAKDPDERYTTSQEMTDTLEALLKAGFVLTPPPAGSVEPDTTSGEAATVLEVVEPDKGLDRVEKSDLGDPKGPVTDQDTQLTETAEEEFPETEVSVPSFVSKAPPETEVAVPSFVRPPVIHEPELEKRERNWLLIGIIGVVAGLVIISGIVAGGMLLFSGASGDDEVETPEETAAVQTAGQPTSVPSLSNPPPEEVVAFGVPTIPGGFLEKALTGEFAGTQVTFDGPFADIDQVLFEESISFFEEATGIDINYIGDKEFEARIAIAVDGGNAPDIADFPQPGTAADFARLGHVVDVTSFIPEDWLLQQYNDSWLDMATMKGPDGQDIMAGTWYRMNTKSQVFYPKAQFDAAGYEVPETWDELMALTQLIADDGDTAWCIGIESGAATGWPATDWTEEVMLRTTFLENYDAWIEGSLDFDTPVVRNAIETWSEIWFNPDYVFGGTDGIVSTNFGDSPAAMFEDPPKCWLHKQGNFITGFFPEGKEFGEDWDLFYLPPIDDDFGRPFLVAGDINVMFNDRPEVRAVMEFMTVPQSASAWLQNGGALAAHKGATPDMYGQEVERRLAEMVNQATSFRFDASDLMPGSVGSGSFWTGMVDYVSGAADLDTVLREVDASWPEDEMAAVREEIVEEPLYEGANFLERAFGGEFEGREVLIQTMKFDEEGAAFEATLDSFEETTGITINHVGTSEHEPQIADQVRGGNAPDIAMFSQPALLRDFVNGGYITSDVRDFIGQAKLEGRYAQGWLDSATFEGPDGQALMAGVWWNAANKDLVWYNKVAFDAAGYAVPHTWDELLELSDTIVADGGVPWCIGMESGFATGWVATDWVEAIMLRTAPAEDYDAWIAGKLPFNSDQVMKATQLMADIWFNPDYILGGKNQILTESIFDSANHMFENPPACWLHRQAAWVTNFFNEGLEPVVDYDFFYLPAVDPVFGEPVLMAGEIMAMFNDRDEVKAVMEYLSNGDSTESYVRNGRGVSPHRDSNLEWYSTDIERRIAEILLKADTVRFDASDIMPPEVGAGTFWSIMVDYVSGALTLEEALQGIDDSWPR